MATQEIHETATVVVLEDVMVLAGIGVPKDSIAYWENYSETYEAAGGGYAQYRGIRVVLKGGGVASVLGGSSSPKAIFLAGHTVEGFASLFNGGPF